MRTRNVDELANVDYIGTGRADPIQALRFLRLDALA